jgi:tRNA dimethylallyltransferase
MKTDNCKLKNKPTILCIIGPTATGKTALAIKLGKLVPSILISADSRQVYREMDIVTGKDHPQGILISGTDLVAPNETCSVSVWHDAVFPVIQQAWKEHKLPIIVGGTGLYIKSLLAPISSLHIPPNHQLRTELDQLPLPALQSRLQMLSPTKFAQMNHSDQNNPRRLIRAIEIALSQVTTTAPSPILPTSLFIGLHNSNKVAYTQNIQTRVISRLRAGALIETKNLLVKYGYPLPSFSALGYPHLIDYLSHNSTYQELIHNWTQNEYKYSKRQMTWFRGMTDIFWFDLASQESYPLVEKLVTNWYHKTR